MIRRVCLAVLVSFLIGCTGGENQSGEGQSTSKTIGTFTTGDGVREKNVLIGISLYLSDEDGNASAAVLGVEFFAKDFALRNVLPEYSLEIVSVDNAGDALTQVQNLESMVEPGGVLLLGLTSGYEETLAIVPMLEENGMLGLTLSEHSDWEGESLGKNIVSVSGNDSLSFEFLSEDISSELADELASYTKNLSAEEQKEFLRGWTAGVMIEKLLVESAYTGEITRQSVLATSVAANF